MTPGSTAQMHVTLSVKGSKGCVSHLALKNFDVAALPEAALSAPLVNGEGPSPSSVGSLCCEDLMPLALRDLSFSVEAFFDCLLHIEGGADVLSVGVLLGRGWVGASGLADGLGV